MSGARTWSFPNASKFSEVALKDLKARDGGRAKRPSRIPGHARVVTSGRVPEAKVRLEIRARHLDPAAISRRLGCAPSRSWARGETVRYRLTRFRATDGGWRLDSPLARSRPLAAHLRWLLGRAGRSPRACAALARRFKVTVVCGAFLTRWIQVLDLPPDVLAQLGACGWALHLDIYGVDGPLVVVARPSRRRPRR